MNEIRFTEEQKEFLRLNLRWLNNERVDRWIEYLPEIKDEVKENIY